MLMATTASADRAIKRESIVASGWSLLASRCVKARQRCRKCESKRVWIRLVYADSARGKELSATLCPAMVGSPHLGAQVPDDARHDDAGAREYQHVYPLAVEHPADKRDQWDANE